MSVIGVLVSQTITHPLQRMVTFAQQVSSGNQAARLSVYGTDEFAFAAKAINRLLETLVPASTVAQTQYEELQGRITELIRLLTPVKRGDLNIHNLSTLQNTDDAVGTLANIFAQLLTISRQTILYAYSAAQKTRVSATQIDAGVRQVHLRNEAQREQTGLIVSEEEDVLASLLNLVDRLSLSVHTIHGQDQNSTKRHHEAMQMNEKIGEALAHVQGIAKQVQSHRLKMHELSEAVRRMGGTISHITRLILDLTIQVALAHQKESAVGMLATQLKQSTDGAKEQCTALDHDLRLCSEVSSTFSLDVEQMRESILATIIHAQATQTWLEGSLDSEGQTKMLFAVQQELERLLAASRPIADHLRLLQAMFSDQPLESELVRQAQYLVQIADHVLSVTQPFVPLAKSTTVLTTRTFSFVQ